MGQEGWLVDEGHEGGRGAKDEPAEAEKTVSAAAPLSDFRHMVAHDLAEAMLADPQTPGPHVWRQASLH
jgi:hypothetical protein